jgi:hypothetical protein
MLVGENEMREDIETPDGMKWEHTTCNSRSYRVMWKGRQGSKMSTSITLKLSSSQVWHICSKILFRTSLSTKHTNIPKSARQWQH